MVERGVGVHCNELRTLTTTQLELYYNYWFQCTYTEDEQLRDLKI